MTKCGSPVTDPPVPGRPVTGLTTGPVPGGGITTGLIIPPPLPFGSGVVGVGAGVEPDGDDGVVDTSFGGDGVDTSGVAGVDTSGVAGVDTSGVAGVVTGTGAGVVLSIGAAEVAVGSLHDTPGKSIPLPSCETVPTISLPLMFNFTSSQSMTPFPMAASAPSLTVMIPLSVTSSLIV